MEPQSPFHPSPPDPSNQPTGQVPTGLEQKPPGFSNPEFGPPSPEALARSQPSSEYSFIMNQGAPPPRSFSFGAGQSKNMRIATVVGGIFILLIIFTIIKNILGGGPSNSSAMRIVAEDQTELMHIAAEATTQQGTDSQTLYSATTANASIGSDQIRLFSYLKTAGIKIKTANLTLKESDATDLQLTNAAANGLYDQTYQQIMESQLGSYQSDLKQAYDVTSGKIGKALLSSEYNDAKLLILQLTSPIG
jgi:hypothetical protein